MNKNKIHSRNIKLLTFDLDTNELKKYYPTNNWHNAYEDIKKYMQKNGFEWIQGSGYMSKTPISTIRVYKIIGNFINNNPWINLCMRDCRVANIDSYSNLNILFNKSLNVPIRNTKQVVSNDAQKKHIQELKKNGFQPSKDILKKMEQLDTLSGKYVGLKEIRDIFKNKNPDVSPECKKFANEIGQTLKSQELTYVSYK